jgi:O-antigen ligase
VIGVACFSAHFARRYDLKQLGLLLRGTILVCSILSVLSVIARTPLPGSIGISWVNLEGSFSNKVLASLIALNVSLWTLHAVENPKTRWISGTIAAISFVSIFFMNSVTNIATSATLVYVILLLRAIKRFSLKYVPLAIWASLIIGILSGLAIQIYAADIAGGFGKDTSLSGRTKIWPAIIEQIAQKPWTGYGYDGYWQTSLRFDLPIPVLHSHNGLLELGLQLGIPGIILYLVSLSAGILIAFKHFFRHSSLQTASLPLLLLIYTQVTSFAETYRLGVMGPNYIWFFFVLTQISLTSTSKNS